MTAPQAICPHCEGCGKVDLYHPDKLVWLDLDAHPASTSRDIHNRAKAYKALSNTCLSLDRLVKLGLVRKEKNPTPVHPVHKQWLYWTINTTP